MAMTTCPYCRTIIRAQGGQVVIALRQHERLKHKAEMARDARRRRTVTKP